MASHWVYIEVWGLHQSLGTDLFFLLLNYCRLGAVFRCVRREKICVGHCAELGHSGPKMGTDLLFAVSFYPQIIA